MTGIAAPPPPIRAFDLALEVILSSDAPLLMLDGNLLIVAASKSFCRAFHINPSTTIGKPMADLGAGNGTCRSWIRCCAPRHQAMPRSKGMK